MPALPPQEVPKRTNHVTHAAHNQCGPIALAHSLAYMRDRFGLEVPHEHKAGLGVEGDYSLVGELDRAPDRDAADRTQGDSLGGNCLVRGKLKYLADNGLADRFAQEHRGLLRPFDGDFVTDDGVSMRTGFREDISWQRTTRSPPSHPRATLCRGW